MGLQQSSANGTTFVPLVDSPHKVPVTWISAYFRCVSLNKMFNKQSICRWSETSWSSGDVILMSNKIMFQRGMVTTTILFPQQSSNVSCIHVILFCTSRIPASTTSRTVFSLALTGSGNEWASIVGGVISRSQNWNMWMITKHYTDCNTHNFITTTNILRNHHRFAICVVIRSFHWSS